MKRQQLLNLLVDRRPPAKGGLIRSIPSSHSDFKSPANFLKPYPNIAILNLKKNTHILLSHSAIMRGLLSSKIPSAYDN